MGDNEGSGNSQSNGADGDRLVVRCRGLPWSCSAEEVVNFFEGCTLAGDDPKESVHMTLNREGRPSGECYVELASKEDFDAALKKDRKCMGKRYVEVFGSKYSEMEWVLKRQAGGDESGDGDGGNGTTDGGENVVRLRGLPFEATKSDITDFFEGLEITNNGILLTTNYQGRATGEAFVQFASKAHVEKALEKNKESIGHRYIEIFQSSMAEAFRNQHGGGPGGGGGFRGGPMGRGGYGMMRGGGRPGPYDRMPLNMPMGRGFGPSGPGASRGSRSFKSFGGNSYGDSYDGGRPAPWAAGGGYGGGMGGGGGNGFVVRMRGLPFRVTENDIAEWFSSVADPCGINIRYNNQGRPTGEADVMFNSARDAKQAMSKDRQNMQHRYVELFYDGPDPGPNDAPAAANNQGYSTGGGVGFGGNTGGGVGFGGNTGMMAGGGSVGFGGQGGGFGNGFQSNMSGGFGSY